MRAKPSLTEQVRRRAHKGIAPKGGDDNAAGRGKPGKESMGTREGKDGSGDGVALTGVSAAPSPLLLPSGCTMLNLACSGRADGAYAAGEMANIIGDRSAGKSLLALTMAADLAANPAFDGYDIRYNDAEGSSDQFDPRLFGGERFATRVVFVDPPSETVEAFASDLRATLAGPRPCVYFIDTYDALSSEEEAAHVEKADKARAAGKAAPGTYGQSKAKGSSELFRTVRLQLKRSSSLLVIVSQVRENIGAGPFEPKYRRNGGKALDHYAYHILWLATTGSVKRTVGKQGHIVGQHVQARVTKNKVTGKRRTIAFDTLYDYGVDDLGACYDYLAAEGAWTNARVLRDPPKDRTAVLREIEATKGAADRLRRAAGAAWGRMEEALLPGRRPKYGE